MEGYFAQIVYLLGSSAPVFKKNIKRIFKGRAVKTNSARYSQGL